MPLTQWTLDNRNQPLFSFYGDDAVDWVLDAPYQRQPVWTLADRLLLMESVFEHLPIGAIYVNRRHWGERNIQVVDGQQRIRAIRAFAADEVPVPVKWFDDEALALPREEYADGTVRFSGLSKRWQFARFGMFPVAVYWTDLPDVESEARLYLRLNRGGMAQTDADLARAAAVAGQKEV